MAIRFRPLPLEVFTEAQRPYIAHMNTVLRELTALEGVIRQPRSSRRRSDASVTRRAEVQVDVSRITPSITQVVSGQSTVVGRPALILGTVNTVGTTATAVSVNSAVALFGTQAPRNDAAAAAVGTSAFAARADHAHRFPTSLESAANNSTIALTDDGVDQTLTGSLGQLNLRPAAFTLSLPRWTAGGAGTPIVGAVLAFASLTSALPALVEGIRGSVTVDDASTGLFWGARFNCGPSASASGLSAANFSHLDFSLTTTINLAGTQTVANRRYIDFGVPRLIGGVNTVVTDTGLMQSGAWQSVGVTAATWTNAYASKLAFPTVGSTIRRGHWLTTTTGNVGTAPANAEGFYCEDITQGTSRASYYGEGHTTGAPTNCFTFYAAAHAVGANRYAFYGVSDTLYHGGKFQHAGVQLGLHGATPSSQYGATGTVSGFAAGTSTAVTVDSTFTGNTGTLAYALGDLVFALKQKGILAY